MYLLFLKGYVGTFTLGSMYTYKLILYTYVYTYIYIYIYGWYRVDSMYR